MAARRYAVRILRNGDPVEGAQVTCGTHIDGVTGADGIVSGRFDKGDRAIVVPVIVEGDGFSFGASSIRIAIEETVDIQV